MISVLCVKTDAPNLFQLCTVSFSISWAPICQRLPSRFLSDSPDSPAPLTGVHSAFSVPSPILFQQSAATASTLQPSFAPIYTPNPTPPLSAWPTSTLPQNIQTPGPQRTRKRHRMGYNYMWNAPIQRTPTTSRPVTPAELYDRVLAHAV